MKKKFGNVPIEIIDLVCQYLSRRYRRALKNTCKYLKNYKFSEPMNALYLQIPRVKYLIGSQLTIAIVTSPSRKLLWMKILRNNGGLVYSIKSPDWSYTSNSYFSNTFHDDSYLGLRELVKSFEFWKKCYDNVLVYRD